MDEKNSMRFKKYFAYYSYYNARPEKNPLLILTKKRGKIGQKWQSIQIRGGAETEKSGAL